MRRKKFGFLYKIVKFLVLYSGQYWCQIKRGVFLKVRNSNRCYKRLQERVI